MLLGSELVEVGFRDIVLCGISGMECGLQAKVPWRSMAGSLFFFLFFSKPPSAVNIACSARQSRTPDMRPLQAYSPCPAIAEN